MQLAVSFTSTHSLADGLDIETFRCRETGVCYQLETHRSLGMYSVFDSGNRLGLFEHRDHALNCIEQNARLDFWTAQSDCGVYSELDGSLAV